jgi:hypothetical protein
MAEAVGRRPVTAEASIQSQVSPREICGGQSASGTGFSPITSVSPVIIIPPMLLTYVRSHVAVTRKTYGRSLRTFQKRAVSEIGKYWIEKQYCFLVC